MKLLKEGKPQDVKLHSFHELLRIPALEIPVYRRLITSQLTNSCNESLHWSNCSV